MLTGVITRVIMGRRGVRVMGLSTYLRGLLEAGVYRSQYHMAEVFGSKQPTVNHWLQRVRFPSRESCLKISIATGKPLVEIVDMVHEDTRAAISEAATVR